MERSHVNLADDYDVRDWCETFGCTEGSLRAAIRACGNRTASVREWLATGKTPEHVPNTH